MLGQSAVDGASHDFQAILEILDRLPEIVLVVGIHNIGGPFLVFLEDEIQHFPNLLALILTDGAKQTDHEHLKCDVLGLEVLPV